MVEGKQTLPEESSFDEKPLQLNETGNISRNTSSIHFFELFCSDEYLHLPVDESNLHNKQRSTD